MNVDDDDSSGESDDENDAEESDDHPKSKLTLKAFVVGIMPKRFINAVPGDAVRLFIELLQSSFSEDVSGL
jgi:hypothetical protein